MLSRDGTIDEAWVLGFWLHPRVLVYFLVFVLHIDFWQTHQLGISKTECSSSVNKRSRSRGLRFGMYARRYEIIRTQVSTDRTFSRSVVNQKGWQVRAKAALGATCEGGGNDPRRRSRSTKRVSEFSQYSNPPSVRVLRLCLCLCLSLSLSLSLSLTANFEEERYIFITKTYGPSFLRSFLTAKQHLK